MKLQRLVPRQNIISNDTVLARYTDEIQLKP